MDKKEKALKRLLKELGLYKVYIRDRLKQCTSLKELWRYKNHNFPSIIDCSFTWAKTEHAYLWEMLYNTAPYDSPETIIKDEDTMNRLRDSCKSYCENLQ